MPVTVKRVLNLCLSLTIAALVITSAQADIIYESGTLQGFLGGSCPGCEYDNWISHISEGIASPGYNHYGPRELDPQTTGFGRYQLIEASPAGDSLIAVWYSLFTNLFAGDTATIASYMNDTGLDSIYQLVILTDVDRQYYILREILNMQYHDDQLTPEDSTDDEWGSFDYGWGVYVFSPTATKPWMLIEMPHPTDDYLTPFLGTVIFEGIDAGVLMIAGAGREVLWTQQGEYNNSKSLSDPSRNYQTVFNTAHRAFVDYYEENFALQLHSYDSEPHLGQKNLVISAGADDQFPNEPVLDRCVYDDMISLTPSIPVLANTAGTHDDVTIGQYYQLYYEGGYSYQGTSPVIPTTNDLYGYGQNQQTLYSHIGNREFQDSENFVHIEMDELPDAIQDTITVYYRTYLPGPVTFNNFTNVLLYFGPAYQALEQAMLQVHMDELVSSSPSSLVFPNIIVYDTDTLWVNFFNDSPSQSLDIVDVYADDNIFSVNSAPIGTVLYPGQQCSVSVVFHPANALNYHRILTLSTDIGCSHVELIGTGLGGVAGLVPSVFNFGPVDIHDVGLTTIQLRNVGNYPMNLLSLTNAPPHFFFMNFPTDTILPSNSVPLEVIFLPSEIGTFIDTMYLTVNTYSNDTLSLIIEGEAAVLTEIFFDDFSQDLGWTGYGGEGEWTRGAPMGGLGDDEYGGPDPLEDHSPDPNNFVVGNDLTQADGDYEASLGEVYWLTSPIIDCAGLVDVQLKYWRWLGVERNLYDHAYFQVFDGTNWVTKWQNPGESIDEVFWSQQVVDVSAQADNNANFQIRFGIGTTDGSWQYCGWNIDDVSIIGTVPQLSPIEDLILLRYTDSSIFLAWSPIFGANYYRIYRGETPDFIIGPENLVSEVSQADTSYVDEGILNQISKAFYRVTSGN